MRKVCLDKVHELAKRDERVVYIGSDPGAGTLERMRQEFPERFFIEGIAEQNVAGLAAGMAMEGLVPYVNTISTFLTRRCYEQVAIDICLHNLPVRLIGNGGGVVYAPLGPTHLATEDMALMRALPGMTVLAPVDAEEMGRLMEQTLDWPGPIYIRLAKGGDPIVSRREDGTTIGKAIVMREGETVALLSTGVLSGRCLAAAELLAAEGISCKIVHFHTVKPLDKDAVLSAAGSCHLLATVEEHSVIGGLGSAVADILVESGMALPMVLRLGLPDAFAHNCGSQDDLLREAGLDFGQITDAVRSRLAKASRPGQH